MFWISKSTVQVYHPHHFALLFSHPFFPHPHSSHIQLANLRAPGDKGYKIPRGFLFNYITCANYTAEIWGWILFTIGVQAVPAALFALAGGYQMTVWALQKHKRLRKVRGAAGNVLEGGKFLRVLQGRGEARGDGMLKKWHDGRRQVMSMAMVCTKHLSWRTSDTLPASTPLPASSPAPTSSATANMCSSLPNLTLHIPHALASTL